MTRTKFKLLSPIFAVGIFVGLAACQSSDSQKSPDTSVVKDPPNISLEQNTRKNVMNLNQQLSFSKQDLANRLGIDADTVNIKVARQITWKSGALGCPKPGMNYTQALVPGVLIILEAGGKTYGYHAQENQEPFHCPSRQAVIPDSIQKEDLA